MAFQYVTVRLPSMSEGQREDQWTARMNAVAADGWRLVTISEDPGKGFTSHYATFEREQS